MTLAAGTRLGSYEIVAPLGAGGMGEVYRARDTKLHRDVALKILPDTVAGDADRLGRFRREAQLLAALNDPHIAGIYGFEDSSPTPALVLELVDGPTLADRIAQGSLPLDEALPIARQIAAALETAHEHGIVHRDLKPSNIKLTARGSVKVLDFGLAKLLHPGVRELPGSSVLSQSPTLTSPAMLTVHGIILGTAAYMSPEQAKGRPVDARADIWAFGIVVYEMLTGVQPFAAETVTETLAAVLTRDVDIARLPPIVQRAVSRCLERDPARRLRHIGDFDLLLDLPSGAADASLRTGRSHSRRTMAAISAAALAGAATAVGLTWLMSQAPAAPSTPSLRAQLPVSTPLPTRSGASTVRLFAMSPDARRLVYVGEDGRSASLYLQDLASGTVARLAGTEGGRDPFFAPDGQSVGFVIDRGAESRIVRLRLPDGLPSDVAAVRSAGVPSWTLAGDIVFSGAEGLMRVPADGGAPVVLAALGTDDGQFRDPRLVPGADVVLFAARRKDSIRRDDQSRIVAMSLRTGERRVVVEAGSSPVFVATGRRASTAGHLVYAAANRLMAVPFDPVTLTTAGSPVPVVDDVEMRPNGDAAQFSVSDDGTLAFLPASRAELLSVDRSGTARRLSAAVRPFAMPRVSPDGRMVAVEIQDTPHQVWLLDVARDVLTPVTTSQGGSHNFAWAPDGRSLIVTASGPAGTRLEWTPLDSSADRQVVFDVDSPWIHDWSQDGRFLAVRRRLSAATSAIALLLPVNGSPPTLRGAPIELTRDTRASERAEAISPDGRWVALVAQVGDAAEVVLHRLADGVRFQVSSGGGAEPVWAPDSRELYFRSPTHVMAAAVEPEARSPVGRPEPLFEDRYRRWGEANFDVSNDGKTFVMVGSTYGGSAAHLNLRIGWMEDLTQRVPVR